MRCRSEAEIRSYLPALGRVELEIKTPVDVYVRIPQYVSPDGLQVTLDGSELPKRMVGSYLLVPKQAEDATLLIQFEQQAKIEKEMIAGETYRVVWLGDTVRNITLAGGYAALYYPARLVMYGGGP